MPTGACGINCDVCGLSAAGACMTCGAGTSEEGRAKMSAQKKLLGNVCPILGCAADKGIDYCSRDCGDFPCETLSAGPFPLSEGYLMMQRRRRDNLK